MSRQHRINLTLPPDLHRLVIIDVEDSGRSEQEVLRDRLREAYDINDKSGIGDLARDLIRDGLTNEQVAETIRERRPAAKTTEASVRWYRSKMRVGGEDVLTNIEARDAQSGT